MFIERKTFFSLYIFLSFLAYCFFFSTPAFAAKILFIDSYHASYAWSRDITKAIEETVNGSGHDLKIHRMDTKRNNSADFLKEAGLKAKEVIESYKPDIIIACDDNAQKYLVVPYLKKTALPVVFCGVNWSVEQYGYPTPHITGMIEVSAADELVLLLKHLSKGERIGFLSSDTETERKELANMKSKFDIVFEKEILVSTVEEWKKAYLALQDSTDAVFIMNNAGIPDWDNDALKTFVEQHTKVSSGGIYDWMTDYNMITYAKIAEEQGQWAAKTALDVLDGKDISSIPLTRNTQGKLILNARLIDAAKINVPDDLITAAESIIE